MEELKTLTLEILDKYYTAERSVISEFSGRNNADLEELAKEIEEYRRKINDLGTDA